MTDLRTRIADCCGVTSVDLTDSDRYAVADAVIRELAIEVEDGECGYCQAQLPGCRYSSWANE